ncbi:MAG: response regulator [Planctomycetota bacterium]
MSIRVLVADDHEVVRRGLKTLFQDTDIEIVAEASNGKEAVDRTVQHKPDVVLMDIRMPNVDGLDAMERLKKKSPETPVVVLSTYDNPTYVARTVSLGACDYVLKGAPRKDLIGAITRAAAGDSPGEGSILRRIRATMAKKREGVRSEVPLTERETQVLRHIALGLSNADIARSLSISVETV